MVVEILSPDMILARWEYGEYASAFIVILGVVGEFLAEFTNVWGVRDSRDRRDRLGKKSTLILIVGLVAELVCLVSTNIVSGRIIASLGQQTAEAIATAKGFESQIADSNARVKSAEAQVASANASSRDAVVKVAEANARAAEARSMAEAERLERIRLQAIVAPRSLSLDQQQQIANALRRFASHRVSISSYGMDGEGAALGAQLIILLRSVLGNGNVLDNRATTVVAGGFEFGIHVRGPDAERDFVSSLSNALSMIGELQTFTNDAPPRVASMIGGGGASFPAGTIFVSVMVGIKPVPILPAR
jgi:hypothetical protein